MSHFYLTLPSNSSALYFPDNKVTHFKTRLKDTISLSDTWEVGLSEVHIPKTWQNINKRHGFRFSNIKNSTKLNDSLNEEFIPLTAGYYTSITGLVDEMNSIGLLHALSNDTRPKFFFDDRSSRLKITLPPNIQLNLTKKLSRVLGLARNFYYNMSETDDMNIFSTTLCDLSDGVHSLYFYCDLLECVPVGDTAAPLLKIINIDRSKHGEIIHYYYEKPRYVPLQKKTFETLEIDIRDSFGEHIPFLSGTLIATLHFRKVRENYFTR